MSTLRVGNFVQNRGECFENDQVMFVLVLDMADFIDIYPGCSSVTRFIVDARYVDVPIQYS